MRSLYMKIFLWFLVAIGLVGGTLMFFALEIESDFARASIEQNDLTLTPPFAERWAMVFEQKGKAGLSDYLGHARDKGNHTYFFGPDGKEVFNQTPPVEAQSIVQQAMQTDRTQNAWATTHRYIAQRAAGPSGKNYILLIDLRSPFGAVFLARPQIQALRLIIVLLIGSLVCLWLAQYISDPVARLRSAAHQLAAGNLHSRVGAAVGHGNDELADLGRDFDRMAERIESMMVSQKRLITSVSHELRSPLARLAVALDLAYQDSDPAIRAYLDRIGLETNHLNDLIRNLLNLARMESGSELLSQAPVELEPLVSEIAKDVDFEARSRGCGVRVIKLEPCVILGARDLLHSAIENIIRNGAAYSKQGTEIEVSLERVNERGEDRALIRVRDFGEGVPNDALQLIFQPFYRVADARERASGGFGLGLSITAEAVRLHNGQVRAENCPGGGLRVEVNLPLHAAPAERRPLLHKELVG